MFGVVLCGCGADQGPRIEAIEPSTGQAGERVEITGARFCGDDVVVAADNACDPLPAGYVSFGIDPQIDGMTVAWRDDRIEAIVPASATGTVQVVLTVDGRSSNGVWFEIQ